MEAASKMGTPKKHYPRVHRACKAYLSGLEPRERLYDLDVTVTLLICGTEAVCRIDCTKTNRLKYGQPSKLINGISEQTLQHKDTNADPVP